MKIRAVSVRGAVSAKLLIDGVEVMDLTPASTLEWIELPATIEDILAALYPEIRFKPAQRMMSITSKLPDAMADRLKAYIADNLPGRDR